MPATARRVAAAVREALLWLAALGGLACVALALAGHLLGFGVILFKTGSMSPTIPAGSAALVRAVPADSVRVGDVVTVDRPGTLPVTHRVVEVEVPDDATDPRERSLVLRGDANEVSDPNAYRVTEVRRVLWSVPGVAPAIARAGQPAVLIPVTLGASALVVWGLWPRRRRAADEDEVPGAPAMPALAPATSFAPVPVAPAPAAVPGRNGPPRHASARRRRRARAGARAAARSGATLLVLAAVVAAQPVPAQAAELGPSPDGTIIDGEHLRLVSIGDPVRMSTLSPGGAADWIVGILPFQEDVTATRTLQVSNGADDLTVEIDSCSVRWTADGCARPHRLLEPTALPPEGSTLDLVDQTTGVDRWLRIRVRLEDGADQGTGHAAVGFSFVATGYGETVETGFGGDDGTGATGTGTSDRWRRLATTGAPAGGVLALGLALVVAGTLVTRRVTEARREPS